MMSKNVRILLVAVGLVLLGCVSGVTAANPVPEVRDMLVEAGATGPVINLRSTDGLETVHYSPQPGVWVIEMPELSWADGVAAVSQPDLGIDRAELSMVEEFGKTHARLTVWLSAPAELDLAGTAQGLTLRFTMLDDTVVSPESASPAVPEPAHLATLPRVVTRAEIPAEEPAAGETATGPGSLLGVVCTRSGDGVIVELRGDRALEGSAFTLPAPDRLVIDLDGVINRIDRHVFPVGSAVVEKVRVAQFKSLPHPVTRLVVDLKSMADYQLVSGAQGAVLTIGDAAPVVVETLSEPAPVVISGTTISNLEGDHAVTVVGDDALSNGDRAQAERTLEQQLDVPPPVVEEVAPVIPERNPWQADPSQLVEEAAAATELDLPDPSADTYATTEVATGEVQFTGDPISLTLKDADIKDVLKTFSALTQLNIVIDPEVNGSVTVELRDVPWDQALDLILRINGLDYLLENNVLRVSTVTKLTREKNERAAYLAQQEVAQPLKTVVKPLSYATAKEVSALLSGDSYLMSDRGSVVVDERTNTLIIRDTIDRVEGVLRLIDTLDQPTPQVVIEGRIVETTRTFSRDLGITWGFNSVNDVAHGNTTGSRFPNTITTEGGVNLGGSNNAAGVLSMAFGDILNTFNLDFLLSAAESEGVAKIVSTPRVTTQNLKTASIRSGLQIPVQTVANNTVTVQYVDATLRLQVTPQITAEGTVNLKIDIRKQQPLQAGQIVGGNNAPILTRDAQTELLVRDGGTTVIGGIYQIDDQDQDNRVPGLWKIPVLGHLFRNKSINQRHDELLIFITPRIVKY
jgi:type IV pilus assembly protein PilQ